MSSQLDSLTQTFIDKLCAIKVDVLSLAKSIKNCCRLLERVDHNVISIRTKHKLCRGLAISYFILLEQEENFPEILSYIRISLTCMSLLKQSSIASHILCQALLERSLVYGHLFNADFIPLQKHNEEELLNLSNDYSIRLSEENHKATLGHRFRRLPNHVRCSSRKSKPSSSPPSKTTTTTTSTEKVIPNKLSINCYLLIEAFKSSINNIEAFALLFVEFHCPITFDKLSWPNDEALRVTNEKNLSILRKFEQIPPFWDLYELIGQAGCLGSCMTLVKALFTANLALWSSATANSAPDKMTSTSRLIPPLAQSNLIPRAFGLAVEVFPKFGPTEVFAVLTDIWQYLKDTNYNNNNSNIQLENMTTGSKKLREKTYLNRLRLFMCQHSPGEVFIRIMSET